MWTDPRSPIRSRNDQCGVRGSGGAGNIWPWIDRGARASGLSGCYRISEERARSTQSGRDEDRVGPIAVATCAPAKFGACLRTSPPPISN